jgi:hypothetical protein
LSTTVGDVDAWSADVTEEKLPRDARAIARATIAHDRVIQDAMGSGAVIPALLTDPYPDLDAMRAELEQQASAVRAAFEKLGLRVEMSVVVRSVAETAPLGDSPGRTYLESLRAAPQRSADVLRKIETAVGTIRQTTARRSDGATSALSSLIDPADIARYRDLAGAVAAPQVTVGIDGPRAPYSFAAYAAGRGMVGSLFNPA